MKEYMLVIEFVNGTKRELMLKIPHQLVPNQATPSAVTYQDGDIIHNIPFSSILDFSFDPKAYMEVEQLQRMEPRNNPYLPTPGCNCDKCKEKIAHLKTIVA